uniref:RBR-type E3 ubiquitin transferase n=1 Tax=Oncorhynchus tshawytscha TaxID=74940 RepID=A0A8C8LXT4_ONCTS
MASTLSDQLEEVRCHAEACLYSTGSVLEVRRAHIFLHCLFFSQPFPVSNLFHLCPLSCQTIGSLQRLSTALNILEKYGCNLTSSSRPKYWRAVKHNNPVFRATVDAIQGGRAVLCLYGYSNQQPDGLSFPDEVVEPDIEKVAAVTLEVMSLRMELDMLIKTHRLEVCVCVFFTSETCIQLSLFLFPFADNCTICAIFPVAAHCNSCVQWLCTECDRLYHSSAERANHHRTVVTSSKIPCVGFTSSLSFPAAPSCHGTSSHSPSPSLWWFAFFALQSVSLLCISMYTCLLSENGKTLLVPVLSVFSLCMSPEWQCKSCTVVNAGSSILCEVCERPRLATKPPLMQMVSSSPILLQWMCQFCTYINYTPASVCEMCDLPRPEPTKMPVKVHPPSQVKKVPVLSVKPKDPPMEDPDLTRQKLMREEGLKLIQLIRDGEKKGVSPEEVYTGMRVSGVGNILPCDWLKAELPHLLDQICATEEQTRGGGVTLSRAEAKLAWLSAGGDTERAAKQALRDRHSKVKELCSLGFTDEVRCQEVLRQSEGEVRGALSLLQRPLMEPFHQRMWSDQPEPPIDINHPDKQRVCRRLLAVYDLPSWGRCELALSLLQERTAPYSLDDVVQAVRESHDRDFIRRVLAKECPICLSDFPHSKMQSLTSCQCSVCCGCFQQHFTIAVRDKHIRDMVCPVCWEPDINDPEHLNSYFSTLDIQLRECLEPEVYDLFHKKLTEQALIKDPKFLWCSHCSYGFIYDGDQLKVTCFQCRNSFCAQCKKPWESQHGGLSCERYQSWKRENDPEYQRQGLAGYLRDNGITCPNCRFQYALSKGGCMHFSCSQCRYQFCSGCNNPFHTTCAVIHCSVTGLHAHHPRDCLFYLRDWEPGRLQALLQNKGVEFNTDTPPGTQAGLCGVIEQKDESGQQTDSACGAQTQPGHAGLCEKHYREYLVSLINGHSIDPAPLFNANELVLACRRYQVDDARGELEDDVTYYTRILEKLIDEVPLGDKVPRKK